ncbi:class I SAM-dependent methyltransferase [Planctomicrobium sp. SH527]|uniref:class I SAM-dependent methyltransferase n=1 Tax=Planctomicrobium sp. SH527 TaxID=3448123 RepID=UPI003F5B66DE
MTTDYNQGSTAEQYKQAKEDPWRSRIETFSLMKVLGDLQGQRVVDAACGEGHFTRKLRNAGAAEVVGFDISERMIDLARSQESQQKLGIEYCVADARDAVAQQDYDLVASAWLLVYARTRAELDQMCHGLASRLRSGGRFVTFTTNPGLYHFDQRADYRKYGFEIALADDVEEGAPIQWRIPVGDSVLEIENYYLPVSSYEEAFQKAGFSDFRIHDPELSPNPQGENDQEYWSDFLRNPPAILIECVKN